MIKKKISVDEILAEFNNRSKLSDLISQYVTLNQRGNSFIGKCPFHNEKTPSFSVSDEKGLFYCFGCKIGGNALTFLTKYKNFSFIESVNYLSNYIGLNISLANSENLEKNKNTFEIIKNANDFFVKSLKHNRFALAYLKNRNVNLNVIEKFQIGFCPDDNLLIDHFKIHNKTINDLNDSDLLIKNKEGKFFGRFRDRITFPIFNFGNKIVGFGGRTINDSKIKYINSHESELFKKGEILFGLTQNFDDIKNLKEVILVEGYMDVVSMYQNDIRICVAPLGTTLSEKQILKLWTLSDIPYICFDGDSAGRSSTKNVAIKILEHLVPGKSFKFIRLPNNDDPDTFLKQNSKNQFEILRNDAEDLSNFIWSIILDSVKELSPEFIVKIDETIKHYSNKIRNKSISTEYYKFLKNKKDKFIWKKNLVKQNNYKQFDKQKVEDNVNEKLLIIFALFEKDIFESLLEDISKIKFQNQKLEVMKNELVEIFGMDCKKKNVLMKGFEIKNEISISQLNYIRDTHLKKIDQNEKVEFLKQILNNLKLPELILEKDRLKEKIVTEKNSKEQEKLMKKHNEIINEIKSIRNKELE